MLERILKTESIFLMVKQYLLKPIEGSLAVILFSISSFCMVHAAPTESEISSVEQAFPSLTQEDTKQKLEVMKLRLNASIEEWGSRLTRDDFEWTWQGKMLKQSKRVQICNIFQSVINDTYLLLRQNQESLSDTDQKNIENRQVFIQQLGIKNNTIPTKMGFNCIVK
ncbi:hypothetical protein B9T31_10080 [Acinetobacter sp. ANC 4558]|nr:hypothetical protein B9T31_10080 [Acinetobacter sp. ANC 4558]